MNYNKNYAGVIIEDANGKLLFQLRDSETPHPKGLPVGKSAFGGVGHQIKLANCN